MPLSRYIASGDIEARLSAEMVERYQQLAAGMAADWADYRERVGFIKGVCRAMDIVEELAKDGRRAA